VLKNEAESRRKDEMPRFFMNCVRGYRSGRYWGCKGNFIVIKWINTKFCC